MPIFLKSGSLKLLESSGPVQACNGIALTLPLIYNFTRSSKLCLPSGPILHLYKILRTVNTQHTSRQDAVITIRLYLATCFGRERPSSGQLTL